MRFDWRNAPRGNFAVLGNPIEHSLSPKMHAAAFKALGRCDTYFAYKVLPDELPAALEHLANLDYEGVNVTVPLKEEAFRWVEGAGAFARRVSAVNTIHLESREGTNTDGIGFLDTLRDLEVPSRATVLLLGAGGSARALAAALYEAGYRLRIHNRTPERALAMVAALQIEAEVLETADPTDASLIVNATSAWLQGKAPPVEWGKASSQAIAYDLGYGAIKTAFLRDAERWGLRCVDGIPLLVAQGARSLEWWLGIPAPREVMLKAVR